MEYFSAVPQADINSSTLSCQRHAVFHYFLSDNGKQDAATFTAHRKRFISLLKGKKVLTTALSKILEKLVVVLNNTDVPLNSTLFQLCHYVTPSLLIEL